MRRLLLGFVLASGAAFAQPGGQPAPGLDNLDGALKVAPSEEAAAALEGQIRAAWARAASPAVKLLIQRARREMEENAPGDALDSFDAALDLAPDLLEGWRGRAAARRALGDYAGAVRDLQQLLKLEPNSFITFQELSRLAEARGDWRGAYVAWQKLLELDPRTPGGQTRLRDLQRRALGEQS